MTAHQPTETAHDRLDALEQRVAELEAQIPNQPAGDSTDADADDEDGRDDETPARYGDHRDQKVMDSLDSGAIVGLRTLQSRYHHHTDVQTDKATKTRIRNLTKFGPFERAGTQSWRYISAGRGDAND